LKTVNDLDEEKEWDTYDMDLLNNRLWTYFDQYADIAEVLGSVTSEYDDLAY